VAVARPIEGLRKIRLEKLAQIRKLGIEPYPANCQRQQTIAQALMMAGQKVAVAGRIRAQRGHGGIQFWDLQDESGKIQLVLKADRLITKDQRLTALLDIGDFIAAQGEIFKTKAGEISILVKDFQLLTKAIRPLPSDWYGLKDQEERYRKRYLDLLMSDGVKQMFVRKAQFWRECRRFMAEKGFMEVEMPVLEHVTGGADAKPFITHHNALDEDFYLRISTELYQKRLIGAGFEKIYTLAPNFRNEGMDDEHLQEYYQLEWYWAYVDYRDNMGLTKELFRRLARKIYGKTSFTKNGLAFDLANEWREIDYQKIIKEKLGVEIMGSSEEELRQVLVRKGVKLEGGVNRERLVDHLWKLVRLTIAGPAFLVNEPKLISPLAKSRVDQPEVTERFHIIIGGSELGNGYSELNDPIDQLARFKEQEAARAAGDEEAQMLDMDFVEMLEYGMPPTSGFGMSERVFWFLEGVTAREGTLFPQMKRL
jgi:lysyl-tRNA synthetase class 2